MKIRTIVGIGLLAFLFVFGSVLLFGFFADPQSSVIFTVGYFGLFLTILCTAYAVKRKSLEGAAQHMIAILFILIVSSGFAAAVGNAKEGYLAVKSASEAQAQLEREIQDLEATTLSYLGAETEMQAQLMQLLQQTAALRERMATLKNDIAAAQLTQQTKQYQTELQAAQDTLRAQQEQLAEQAAMVQAAADRLAQQQAAAERAAQLQAAAEQAALEGNTDEFEWEEEDD